MAGNGRYIFLIFNVMMIVHLLFLVSMARHDYWFLSLFLS
jgi:hypothetical protein